MKYELQHLHDMVSEVFSANKVQIATIAVYVLRGEQFVEVLELACMVYKTSHPPSMAVYTHAILSNGTILRAGWNCKTHKVKWVFDVRVGWMRRRHA